jgi:membrane-bound metal-dependent hydrolase YbcI (DUF457 family)
VAGRAGDPSMRGATARSNREGILSTAWVPASAAAAVHLPLRAVVGAIAVFAFDRRAFAGAVFTSHISLLVHCLNRMTQVLTELFDIGLLSPLSLTRWLCRSSRHWTTVVYASRRSLSLLRAIGSSSFAAGASSSSPVSASACTVNTVSAAAERRSSITSLGASCARMSPA